MTAPASPLDDSRPADARDDDVAALADFVAKWRARWPEWAIAEVFIAADQRASALAWAILQQELGDAAWGGADPTPGRAKLGWWQEELSSWSRGARRHPIATVLQDLSAPWESLASTLPSLIASRERPGSVAEAFAALEPFSIAIGDIDRALFGSSPGGEDSRLVSACLLQSRMWQEGDAYLPLDMLARAGSGDAVATWAAELDRQWPHSGAGNRVRRLWAALARQRLRGSSIAEPIPAWRTLWLSWRSARG